MEKIKIEKTENQIIFTVQGKEAVMTFQQKTPYHYSGVSVFVDSKQRGKGFGKLLMQEAINYARENRIKLSGNCSFIKEQLNKKENQDILFVKKINACNY